MLISPLDSSPRRPFQLLSRACLAIAFMAGALFSSQALACGENKFRTGHGLQFHDHRASVYGAVLVYAASDRALAPRVLRRAGHTVVVASDASQVAAAIASTRFDVVIAPIEDVPALAEQLTGAIQAPKIVPIVRQRGALDAARDRYGNALSTLSGGRQIIALVNELISADV